MCSPDLMTRLFRRAAEAGIAITENRIAWDLHGDCTNPVGLVCRSRPEITRRPWVRRIYAENPVGGWRRVYPTDAQTISGDRMADVMSADLRLRCRRCDACLRYRGRLWTARAIAEMGKAQRTWFGTLTLNPHAVAAMLRRAAEKERAKGNDPEVWSYTDRLFALHSEVSEELTKYIKRVRKVSGAKLRYLLAMEEHKSGMPHYHMLVHEKLGSAPVLHKHLARKWNLGFVKWNVIDAGDGAKAGVYACKYLNKAQRARVRASLGYGQSRPQAIVSSETYPPF